MFPIGFLQLNVADTLCVRTTGYCVFMVVNEFITNNTCTSQSLEEGVDRTVTYANNIAFLVKNIERTFETAVNRTICFVKFCETMTEQSIFTSKVNVFAVEEVNDLFLAKFVAEFVSCSFYDITKFRMHFFGQVVTNCVLQYERCATFTGLAVNTDNRFIFTMQICRVNGQIRNFPVRSAGFFHIFVAFTNSVLVRTTERSKCQCTSVRLTFRNVHTSASFVNLFDFKNIGEVQFRINALSKHIQCNSNDVQVTGAFAVTEESTFDTVCACHYSKFCGSNASTTVIVGVDTDNGSFAVFHIAAEIFDLVCVGVSSAHFHCGRQVEDDGIFFRRTHFFHNCFANSDREIDFSTGEAFGRIFVANVHATASNFFLSQLTDKSCTLYCDINDTVHIFTKYYFTLQSGSGVVEMDNNIFSATNCFESFTNKFFASLYQNLNGYIIRNVVAFNQGTQNFIFSFRSGRETNFDFFKTNINQSMEEGQFFFDTHGSYERLVTVTQVNAAPDGSFSNSFVGPLTVRQAHSFKRHILFCLLHVLHKLSSIFNL